MSSKNFVIVATLRFYFILFLISKRKDCIDNNKENIHQCA